MTINLVIFVIFAAILHAAWNALLKGGKEPLLDAGVIALITAIISAIGLCFVEMPDKASWPYLMTGVVVHNLYFLALSYSYKHGDLGPVYSIMRGLPPIIVSLGGFLIIGENLPYLGWAAVIVTSAGLILIGHKDHWPSQKGLIFAVCTATTIATYTLVDGLGTRVSGSVLGYLFVLQLITSTIFTTGIMLVKREAFIERVRLRWRRGLIGTIASLMAYGIVLWAMTEAPMGIVSSLRETSVLFANVFAVLLLGEPFRKRIIGPAILIVIGIVLLNLA